MSSHLLTHYGGSVITITPECNLQHPSLSLNLSASLYPIDALVSTPINAFASFAISSMTMYQVLIVCID